jgi:hypothetical protein
MGRVALIAALVLVAAAAPRVVLAQDIALPIVLDPPLSITPGDTLFGGYQVARTVNGNGNGSTTSVRLTDVLLGYLATCPNGTSGPIFIHLPDATLSVSGDAQVWSPADASGGDPGSYQGQAAAPDVCHGQPYTAPAMLLQVGAYAAAVDAGDALDAVRVRVHLENGSQPPGLTGRWSAEQTVQLVTHTPSPTPSVTPTPTVTPSVTPTPTDTATVTPSVTPSPTPTDTVTPSVTPGVTPTDTVTPGVTPPPAPTVTPWPYFSFSTPGIP